MKTKLFNFRGLNLFHGVCLMTVLILGLYACATTQPAPNSQTQPAKQQTTEPPSRSTDETAPTASSPASPSAVSKQDTQTESLIHLVIMYRASLRAEPLPKGKVITRLKRGEKVVKLKESGNWFYVELSDKTTGWILKKQTREEK